MIEFCKGDMFTMHVVDALVNPVNCVGTSGKGLALEFKKRWPLAYKAYRAHCDRGQFAPGQLFVWMSSEPAIIHFPTKDHWRDKSKLEDIELGLFALRSYLRANHHSFPRVAIPALGCGLGGLDWRTVRAAMHSIFIQEPHIKLYIHEPT